ncbi:MAG: hypothetical protein CO029_00300 [Candidatus Magasanikbacteria bacterium CG_4_9_14_0_2_um_filter_41_10]|uniref:N-end rule aminoacyl transferase C-terminal domain-containing protein n=1 Tax=Candidatus Magasanikbacteria bacterium CG_4_10_14_0_2_um_filter_41_31 TaxID=1974639 RepID=A0A2M7V1T8_9BACT|nr:MAG: hypothetical protein AUJ37_00480 [Candidatus Magasanikbacteria bacterium CG1_02_41_34]PIZ92314.1 MAG: hypothetical protein COX83_04440 [Candidatus Magasanikbacteria bacterium CG_4_10_14_0_2_um_filter_41_31]PJC53909.1 MAG: hypothetical protein CO029_00300 [Candidatus Magasanikbacteria bacterium CG_4_9_14_0_2_um_filter_41_10]
MSEYLKWKEEKIIDFSAANISSMYDRGFVCVRPENGMMQQTRSIRIDLSKFELSSENKRILRKTEGLELKVHSLPYAKYSWEIGKMGKYFYEQKFGDGTFSANKVKELLTGKRDDFNRLFVYSSPYQRELEGVERSRELPITEQTTLRGAKDPSQPPLLREESFHQVGYCIAVETTDILHYSYPFYNLSPNTSELIPNLGMGMMVRAVEYAKEQGKKYIYLGSFQRPGDVYKLQFSGMEWFDGKRWKEDEEELKKIL